MNSPGYFLLQEGVAMCDLWTKSLGGGKALPSEYASFLRYREDSKPKVQPKAKPAEDESGEDAPEEEEG